MSSQFKKINPVNFAIFFDNDLDVWSILYGTIVNHSSFGYGKIVHVEQRIDYIPLIHIKFDNINQVKIFNSNSFKSGNIITLKVTDKVYSLLQKWKNKIINQIEISKVTKNDDSKHILRTLSKFNLNKLWHITHQNNIINICRFGILSHKNAYRLNPPPTDISNTEVQRWRDRKDPHFNCSIHEYVPLYINPKNPMLYSTRNKKTDICLIEIDPVVIAYNRFLLTDGNAASYETKFFYKISELQHLPWELLKMDSWNETPDGKRKMCAEVLIYEKVATNFIKKIHCFSEKTSIPFKEINKPLIITPRLYF